MANEIPRQENQLAALKEEIFRIFTNLHKLVDERKELILKRFKKLEEVYEKNCEAERALKQLQQFRDAGANLLTSNLLEESKDTSLVVIDKQIEDWKRRQTSMNLLSKHQVVWDESELKSALKRVNLVLTDACYSERNLPILTTGKQGIEEGNLFTPFYIALLESKNEVFIADSKNHRIAVHNMEGDFLRQFNRIPIENPRGLYIADDAVFVTDNHEHALYKFNTDGEVVKTRKIEGTQLGAFENPTGVACFNSNVYVCDFNNNRIQIFDLQLEYRRRIVTEELVLPSDITFKSSFFYVLTTLANIILQYRLDENLMRVIRFSGQTSPISEAYFFAIDNHQHFLVSDKYGGCIKVFSLDGKFKQTLGKMKFPRGIAVAEDSRVIHVCENLEGSFQIY